MLSFVTEFPVDQARSSDEFLAAIKDWVLGSPHTKLKENDIATILSDLGQPIKKGNESIEALRAFTTDGEVAGIKYCRSDDGLEWLTNLVFSRTPSDSWVGIRISCESLHPAVRLPAARKPIVVKTLLKRFGGASDGELNVKGKPLRLTNSDIDSAARLIKGTSGCRLPIVYVSAGFRDNHIVDCNRLADDLAGMAHVIVEPNRPFSLRLKLEVDSENVYGGTIGVYWPDSGGRRSYFVGKNFESPDEIARALFEEIRTALTNRRALERCTWAFVQETASRQKIQALQASGSQEVDKYIENFGVELTAKNQKIEDAEREIERLRSEIRKYEVRLPAGTASPLKTGSEQDLYPDETFNILRAAVEDACTRVPADSRRLHVLNALLEANPSREDRAGSMRDQLKQLLRGSKKMDAHVKRGLEEMGFAITEDGKHYKLVFLKDDRYTFTLSKSGSDHRGGLNAAGDIGRLLF